VTESLAVRAGAADHDLVRPSAARGLIADIGAVAQGRHIIRGLLEIDVTEPRQRIRAHEDRTRQPTSFTGFLVACVGRAVAAHRQVHACRDWRGRLVLYRSVDVSTMIEVERGGQRMPVGHIVRAANEKSVRAIHDEIRAAKARAAAEPEERRLQAVSLLPGFARRLALRLVDRSPPLARRAKGTVVVSAVGMFGKGLTWGFALPSHTLGVTVGGIATKPGVVDGRIEPREYLHVTLDFDHDIVDGAPAARFAARLQELIETGHGLASVDRDPPDLEPGRGAVARTR
jgi:pyruvate/2-oxoglutarate dehydrogenase complex dihydrolipoamide acyltransferase (E2) component